LRESLPTPPLVEREPLDLTDAERGALADHIKANVWPAVEEMVGKDVIDRLREDK